MTRRSKEVKYRAIANSSGLKNGLEQREQVIMVPADVQPLVLDADPERLFPFEQIEGMWRKVAKLTALSSSRKRLFGMPRCAIG